jgi:ATP-binding protein involved in chromosome partitioning
VIFEVVLGYPSKSQFDLIRKACIVAIREIPEVSNVSVSVRMEIVAHAVQRGVKLIPEVKNVIAVASGKGGVGKSTTAVNLALALAAEGANVGILDADIYGPSIPTMLGITGRPDSYAENSIEPMQGHGLQASSIGFLIEADSPMVWRGPMVTSALEQLLRQTNWQGIRLPNRRYATGNWRYSVNPIPESSRYWFCNCYNPSRYCIIGCS